MKFSAAALQMPRSGASSSRAERPPAGGQEGSVALDGQTPPAVGVTKYGASSSRAERPPAGGQEGSIQT